MAAINRVGTPMNLCEETLEETSEIIAKKKKQFELKQRTKSPFFIGSIEAVSKKISRLDRKLQSYTELICESRMSDSEKQQIMPPQSAHGRERIERKEREIKEVNQFAGLYSIKSTLLPGFSERAKNISKISLQPSKTNVSKKDSGKPKFVELHQYPGFDATELTPLPDDISPVHMLSKAAEAHVDIDRKTQYKPEFERLFFSEMGQAVLQDMFWYIFVEKFQKSQESLHKLFNRISHNYVKLLMYAKNPQYRDIFFKDYHNLVAMAVYASFCESFPDSYRQFGETFKEDLVSLVSEWMTGLRPSPRQWLTWNYDKLEPANIKMREEILRQKNTKKSADNLNLDFLDSMFSSSNTSQYTSNTSLNQSVSRSSVTSCRDKKASKTVRKSGSRKVVNQIYSANDQMSNGMKNNFAARKSGQVQNVEKTAEAQKSQNRLDVTRSSKIGDLRIREMTPIHEMTLEEEGESPADLKFGKSFTLTAAQKSKPIESHPAGKGPDFVHTVFNIQGQSPLVAHFLKMKRLKYDGGTVQRVQRTQMENLPPLDSPTYRDIIKESYKKVRNIERKYQELLDRNYKENSAFQKKQRASLKSQLQREEALLSKPKEVKRLSDLLILEQNRDQDSISAGLSAAIEAALMAAE